jgi:hypothetical protein
VGVGVPVRTARRTAGLALLAGALFAGCAEPVVQVRESAAGAGQALSLRRVAVAPFRAAARPGAGPLRDDATTLVAGYVGDALAGRGLDVVPASDVAQAVGQDDGSADLRSSIEIARDRFGADALMAGTLYRFRERSGEAFGSTHPASVGYEVKLYSSAGKVLWSGVFDHTQVALGENALIATRYPGGGTRWLTAEELARWGAVEIAMKIPLQ